MYLFSSFVLLCAAACSSHYAESSFSPAILSHFQSCSGGSLLFFYDFSAPYILLGSRGGFNSSSPADLFVFLISVLSQAQIVCLDFVLIIRLSPLAASSSYTVSIPPELFLRRHDASG